MGHDITQAEALLALIEPGALLELCTFAANAIRLDAQPDAAFRSALIGRVIADLVARFSYKGIADHRLTTETP
jgi:hypothetical protein